MDPICQKYTREATWDALPEILAWIHQQIAQADLPGSMAFHFELIMEEAVVNVVEHAYPQRKGQLELKSFFYPKDRLEFTLIDEGIPFDPLSFPFLQAETLEGAQAGGLGIHFMRTHADILCYERRSSCNVLRIGKKFKIFSQ